MALTGKMEAEIVIKCHADDIFYMCSGKKAQDVPKLSPENIPRVDLSEDEWGNHGSIKIWTSVVEGKEETLKSKVTSIDEENKIVRWTAVDGDCLKLYKSYFVICQIIPSGNTNILKITIEYEKQNEDVPPPHKYMDFAVSTMKDFGAELVKA